MKLLKVFQGVFLTLLAVVLSVAALLTASAFKWADELPNPDKLDTFEFTSTSQIFARDGTQIGEILPFTGENIETKNRIPVTLDQVSPALLEALVASEDDQFFKHYGFDIPGLAKATYEEFFGNAGRGGSTITTQVVKNELLTDLRSDRSLERKFKELMLAVQLERRLTKPEILQRYVNSSFWGGNAWGIYAAAHAYFDKDPIALTLAESLYLARIVPAPNILRKDFLGTRANMRRVLDNMVAQGAVSEAAADKAWREKIQPRGWNVTYDDAGNVLSAEPTGETPSTQTSVSSSLSDEITFAVRNWLTERYGQDRVYNNGGFKVYTTFDVQAQQAAMEASRTAEAPAGAQLAIVGLDPATGEVLAMVGERIGLTTSESGDRLNRVLQSKRQPGSSFKPIVYATAIEQAGFSQQTLLNDAPTVFKQKGQADYTPSNSDKTYDGLKTIRSQMDRSRNIPAIEALQAATPEAVAARARELGYGDVQPYYSIALGTTEARPIDHTAAIAAFANGGVKMDPFFVSRVEDADGNVIYEATPRETRVWSPQTAYIVLDMMHGNVTDSIGFSNRAKIDGRYVAGKTGTSSDNNNNEKDIWFVGITPGMVASVWIGYDDNTPLPKNMEAGTPTREDGRVSSSRQPIYVWTDFVSNALKGKPDTADGFPVPEGIVFKTMDLNTGAIGSSGVKAAFSVDTALRNRPLSSGTVIDHSHRHPHQQACHGDYTARVSRVPQNPRQRHQPVPELNKTVRLEKNSFFSASLFSRVKTYDFQLGSRYVLKSPHNVSDDVEQNYAQ